MPQILDRYLLYRLQTKQDPDAFTQIYDRYITAIYRFVILKVPRKEDAQDISGEVFLRFWHHIQSKKPVKHPRAFLYRIARNLIADFYRFQEKSVSLEDVTFEGVFTSSIHEDLSQNAETIEARGEWALVLKRMDRLKEDYRDVLVLRLIDGLSFADIAEILEKKPGHVRVIYHRALKAIQELN